MVSSSRRRASPCSRLFGRTAGGGRRPRGPDRACPPSRRCALAAPPFGSLNLVADKIVVALTPGYDREFVALDEHFRGARARIVVGRHHEPIRASGLHRKKIAGLRIVDLAVERQEIPTFANGSNHVGDSRPSRRIHRIDPMERVVVRRTKEVSHSCIGDYEFLSTASLSVQDAREQHARIPHQEASRLEYDLEARSADERADYFAEVTDVDRPLGIVSHGEAAADVEPLETHFGLTLDLATEMQETLEANLVGGE